MESERLLTDLAKQPMSDKEIVLELIKEYNRGAYNFGLDSFINTYLYIVKQVSHSEPVVLNFKEDERGDFEFIIPS